MTLSQLHLVLNHLPVIGAVIAVGLLLIGLRRHSADLRRAGLEVLFLVGLLTLPVYLSGVGAERQIADRSEVSMAVIDAHHDAALLGSILMLLTGMAAWMCLWQIRRITRPARGAFAAVVVLAIATLALMGRAANLGGQIRHPDVSAFQPIGERSGWLTAESIAEVANTQIWAWPAAETLHFIGLWLLFGVVLVVNLRLLGVMTQASFPALHRLLPWAMLGLTINIVTGMVFAIAMPGQYIGWPFYWKIGLLMVAGFNLLYLTNVDAPWRLGPGDHAPVLARTVAGTGIVAWLGVMYFGRMLPFLGQAF